MAVVSLPSNQGRALSFELVRSQSSLTTLTGVTQITSYSDRRWSMRLEVVQQRATDLAAWNLALIQLSDISNVFAYGPPSYSGPSTGYAGASPVVDGADQLGTSLDVDGLSSSVDVLGPGDFISFDTTSSLGSTNRQLIPVVSAVSSDTSGSATISLAYPIRQAPANDAAVNILTPTAIFYFAEARGGIPAYDFRRASGFVLEASERIFP